MPSLLFVRSRVSVRWALATALGSLACASVSFAWPDATVAAASRATFAAAPRARVRTQCALAVAPVDLTLVRQSSDSGGLGATLRLDAVAQADCTVTLSIDLPAGVTLVGGSTSWTGSLARGAQQSLSIQVTLPDTGARNFLGVAEVRRGTARLLRQSLLQVGYSPLRRVAAQLDPVITAPDGTRMMVLPAREVSP